MAQKGPLLLGSSVTVQEFAPNLTPNGKQYTYQVNSDLGTFAPSSAFTSPYIGINASGYYFDEATGAVSSGPVTLNGISDLSAAPVLNVNLLTTLAYQRIQNLVTKSGLTLAAATAQAEREVLAALSIANTADVSGFGTLDISKGREGDKALAAISSVFVQGNTAGNLSALVASIQSDLGANGRITNAATQATLAASAKAVDPAGVAANLNQKFAASGVSFTAEDIAGWIDKDGDGVVARLELQVLDATPDSAVTLPPEVTSPYVGKEIFVASGRLVVNGSPAAGPVVLSSGDAVVVSPLQGQFPGGVMTTYLMSGATRIGRVSFVAGLSSITVSPATASIPLGLTTQFQAMGQFTDGSASDITAAVAWSSSSPTVATMASNSALASGVAIGSTTIAAALGGTSGSAALNVTNAVVQSVSISPSPAATGVAIARPLTATGTFSDGTHADVSREVVWSSADIGIAFVAGGVVTGASLGATTVTATLGQVVGSVDLSVTTNTWTMAQPMSVPRGAHSATLLQNGKILVVGGMGGTGSSLETTEIYNPASDNWTPAAPLPDTRALHHAVLLPNGKVLVAGGRSVSVFHPLKHVTCFLYDPASDTWTTVGSLSVGGASSTATLLTNGKVLLVGGDVDVRHAELFDPLSGQWGAVATPQMGRFSATATLLPNGKVMLAGGRDESGGMLDSVEIYDPAADSWTSAASMTSPRANHTATLLKNGKVLVVGGDSTVPTGDHTGSLASSQIYDPTLDTWSATAPLAVARSSHTATLLPTGKVLVAGGTSDALGSAELFDPGTESWTSAGTASPRLRNFEAVLLPGIAPQVLLIGGVGSFPIAPLSITAGADLYW